MEKEETSRWWTFYDALFAVETLLDDAAISMQENPQEVTGLLVQASNLIMSIVEDLGGVEGV